MRKSTKSAVVAGTVLALTGGGVAFAYWTSTGNGAGEANAGTSSTWAVTTDAATGGLLTPGGPTDSVAFHVKNNNSGVQNLQSVVVTVATSDGTPWSSGTCNADDFTVGTPDFTGGDVASGATVDGTVTLQMNNNDENQDDCKNVTVPLYVSAS